jgi:hypothetical protein
MAPAHPAFWLTNWVIQFGYTGRESELPSPLELGAWIIKDARFIVGVSF